MTKIFLDLHRYLIMVIMFVLLVSCANVNSPVRAYAGAKRPDADIARFLVSSSLEVLVIDGKKLEVPYLPGSQYELEVLPGDHVLKVVYAELWGDPTTSEHVTSDAFYFKISTTANAVYEVKHNGPEDLVDTDFTHLSEIKIWIEQPKTGQTIHAANVTAYGSAITRAFQPSANEQEVYSGMQMSAVQHSTPTTVQSNQDSVPSATSTLTAEQVISQQDALDRLKFWWKLANEKQREVFKTWTEQQHQ